MDTSSLKTNTSSEYIAGYDSDGCWPLCHENSGNKLNFTQGSATRLNFVNPVPNESSSTLLKSYQTEVTQSCYRDNQTQMSSSTAVPSEHRFTIGPNTHELENQNMIYMTDETHLIHHRDHLEQYDNPVFPDDFDIIDGDQENLRADEEDDLPYDSHKQVIVGICAMEKKAQSKPMKEILRRLEDYFEFIKTLVFEESVILNKPIEEWPLCDCLISFHSKGFPLSKAIEYARLRRPFLVNDLDIQYDIQDRRKVYKILEEADIELPRYAVLDRDSANVEDRELIESDDHIEVANFVFNKPFVEKPISAEDHNICIYYPAHAGGGSQRLFRKIGCRSSVYSNESHVRKTGSFIYEEFMPTDGTDVKVYTAGPDYAHAEARKSPALDGKVERDMDGKEIRYPVILTNREKLIARKVCLAFKQTVCGFDLLRANGRSYVCDVNGFSFVKSSMKYYEDCSKILGNMMLRALAPQLHIPWSIPFQLDDPPIVPTTFGRMMELRCVIAVIRHGDRTPKQKMKLEVKHQRFFDLYHKYGNTKNGQAKLKKPKQLQEVLDIARYLLNELPQQPPPGEVVEPRVKLKQLKSVLEMYGHFSGINRKVQLKYQPHGRPRRSSSDDESAREPSLVLILKWGGELTPAGRVQAEDLGRCFRRLYPASGDYSGPQGLGLLRLHSTFRHDLKIYASDEGRVQMTAGAFAKGFLALEGELTPILFQMVKSANTNGLLDNDCESSKCQKLVKDRLHNIMQKNCDLSEEDIEVLNPTKAPSIDAACKFIGNPYQACEKVHKLIKDLNSLIKSKRQDNCYTQEYHLYHGETWDLLQRRWAKLEKDFKFPRSKRFDISKIPDIYDCIKYDLQHNQHTLQFQFAHELHSYAKALADIVIPQEYGMTAQEKLMISLGTCSPLLRKIQADLLRNADSGTEDETESVNRLDPKYSYGVSSPDRHVRTRLYFTSESHIHSLVTALQFGGLLDVKADEQWKRSMEFLSAISELNYLSQIVIMLYEDPTKEPSSDDRFHVEIHFSSGVINRITSQQSMSSEPQGPGFRPHLHNKSYSNASSVGSGARDSSELSSSSVEPSSAMKQMQQHNDSMIKEEPTDEEKSADGDHSRSNSKSSSICLTPTKKLSHSPQEHDEKSLSSKSPPLQSKTPVSSADETDLENNQTLTQANARQLAIKSQQRSLARSYSAIAPLSLQDLFRKNTATNDVMKAGAAGPNMPLSTTHEVVDSTKESNNQNSEIVQQQSSFSSACSKSIQGVETGATAVEDYHLEGVRDELANAKINPAARSSGNVEEDKTNTQERGNQHVFTLPPVTPKLPKLNGRKQDSTQAFSSTPQHFTPVIHNHHVQAYCNTGSVRRRHNQLDQQLVNLPPTYHTIHHYNFTPSTLNCLAAQGKQLSTSMSTSPQAIYASNLHQRYLAHKQQQIAGANRQYFTMSASMPIQFKSSQNPRACSVADVSQYCGGPSSLISTAVISGSSPELVAVCPYSPNIRPLETLHNELSLKQFNEFITRLTRNHRSSSAINQYHSYHPFNNHLDQSSHISNQAESMNQSTDCLNNNYQPNSGSNSLINVALSSTSSLQHSSQHQSNSPNQQNFTGCGSSQRNSINGNHQQQQQIQQSQLQSQQQQLLQSNFSSSKNSCVGAAGVGNPPVGPLGLSPGNSLSNSLIWSGPPSSFASSAGPSSPQNAALELWSKLEAEESKAVELSATNNSDAELSNKETATGALAATTAVAAATTAASTSANNQ